MKKLTKVSLVFCLEIFYNGDIRYGSTTISETMNISNHIEIYQQRGIYERRTKDTDKSN